MERETFLTTFLRREAEIVRQWGAMDPSYADAVWDLKSSSVAKKKQLNGAVAWDGRLLLPPSFGNAPLAAPNPNAEDQAARFRQRVILRVDDHTVGGLGTVQTFVVSCGDCTRPHDDSRPSLRIAVGHLPVGPRVLRADAPCTHCMASGGASGGGCGFVDMSGAPCKAGWLGRGGASLDLGQPTASDRRERPADERWHAWFDG